MDDMNAAEKKMLCDILRSNKTPLAVRVALLSAIHAYACAGTWSHIGPREKDYEEAAMCFAASFL